MRRLARAESLGIEQDDMRNPMCSAAVNMQRRAIAQRRRAREETQAHIDARCRRECARVGEPVTAVDFVLVDAGKIDRAALSGPALLGRAVLRMDNPRARGQSLRHYLDAFADTHVAGTHSARDDRAVARQREHTIDGQAEQAVVRVLRRRRCGGMQMRAQCSDAGSIRRRRIERKYRRIAQRVRREQGRDLRLDLAHARRIDPVDLGQRDRAACDTEQIKYRKVLARLRHHAVVGRDHEQGKVDTSRAGNHRVHETLMSRYVDEAEHIIAIARGAFDRYVGVAELDRNAARLFFLEPVGVDAGQRSHECGLAVVDMPGSAYDHALS